MSEQDSQSAETITHQLKFTPKQSEALDIINSPEVEDVMYGGAKGGGKSVFGCEVSILMAHHIISVCNITEPLEYPIPIGFLGRKRSTDFEKTTLETWKRFIHPDMYRIRPGDKEIIIDEKVKYFYGGLDDQKTINKFNSAEFAFVFIDQAEEISRTDLGMLKGTLRLIINGIKPPYKTLLTSNPAPCFLKQDYIYNPKPNSRFIRALPSDNPFLGPDYVERLTNAFKHRPELVQAYVHGSWDEIEGSDILIKHSWVMSIVDQKLKEVEGRRITSCDAARFGNDETVIYNMVDNSIVGQKIYGMKDAVYTASQIINMAHENNSDLIAIDGDGMGGPIVDMVKSLLSKTSSSIVLLEIRSGKKAEAENDFVNARAEMWFYAAEQIAEGYCSIPNDQELIGQLSSVKYDPTTVAGGKFKLEPKSEYKKRMDNSPDRADEFVYGLWACKKVVKKKFDFGRKDQSQETVNDPYGWDGIYSGQPTGYSVYSL